MSEQSLISVIKTYIRASGPVTCTQIACAINAAPQDVISVIREAVDRGSLAEKTAITISAVNLPSPAAVVIHGLKGIRFLHGLCGWPVAQKHVSPLMLWPRLTGPNGRRDGLRLFLRVLMSG